MTDVSDLDYCRALAREHAYGDYLCALALPPDARLPVLALIALEAELRLVAAKVTEEMLAHIRFAWWREGLEAMAEGGPPRAHPMLRALQPVTQRGIVEPLLHMIESIQEVYPGVPAQPTTACEAACNAILADTPAALAAWKQSRAIAGHHSARFGTRLRLWLALKLLLRIR